MGLTVLAPKDKLPEIKDLLSEKRLREWQAEVDIYRREENWEGWSDLILARAIIDRKYTPPPLDDKIREGLKKFLEKTRGKGVYGEWRMLALTLARLKRMGLETGVSLTSEDWNTMLKQLEDERKFPTATLHFLEMLEAMNTLATPPHEGD